ncbi:succinylglutamate desuccinylase/aspartoacylase family protein [Anaeroselena agilis]|uniref:Succinylglutamate desuccinylase/aspartoacylase family protein n=1 Tax=Anaeroselena agilis TaxID=3063788 RepID=A0ABU3P1W7_9FIRM|nr:succinylglutamate desuccinylase/aspartoacylase family protein [Selenomonadales bacterium 4137-cl]
MVGTKKTALALLVAVVAILIAVTPRFTAMHVADTVNSGPGVTAVKMLGDYFPGLRNTPGDTAVYVLDSGKPGGAVLVVGGTHPNEPSGYLSAILLVEKARPAKGKLIVIPQANASGFTHNDYSEGSPQRITLKTPGGERTFRYGSRATNPVHQWPDPDIYVHAASGQRLSGSETRNLNRAYPGRPDGTLTEKIAYGIVQLIRKEKIGLAVDLHEASPEYPVINAMVAHERAMDVAAVAVLDLEMDKIKIALEPSPKSLRGLSHREWGDATAAMAVLMETANPAQGRLRGATDEALVLTGQDRMYARAAKLGRLFIPYDKNGQPISLRVARHVAATMVLIRDAFEKDPRQAVVITGVPSYGEIVRKGVGAFL